MTEWNQAKEIDLAIVSESERCCILLELKSFIAPAEPREIEDRSKEVEKGIKQIKARMKMAKQHPAPLLSRLGIDGSFCLIWAVASETSIGPYWVQDESVPVVRVGHLLNKVLQEGGLAGATKWLKQRRYLPVEGRDYEVVDVDLEIGDWTLAWYGIRSISCPP